MAVTLRAEVENIDEIIAGLMRFGEGIVQIATDAAKHEAEYELPLTQERVPIKTGQLQLSGRVEVQQPVGGQLTAAIVYGGPPGVAENTEDVDYAIVVHEDLSAKHVIGQAKYAESVVREELESGRSVARMSAEILLGIERLHLGGTAMGKFAGKSGSWVRGVSGKFVGSVR